MYSRPGIDEPGRPDCLARGVWRQVPYIASGMYAIPGCSRYRETTVSHLEVSSWLQRLGLASIEIEGAVDHHACEQSIGDHPAHAVSDHIDLGVRVKFQIFVDLHFQPGYQLAYFMRERFPAFIAKRVTPSHHSPPPILPELH